MLSRLLLFLTASVYLCNGESMPPPQALVPRDAITDCQNLTQGLNYSCWDSVPPNIGMNTWLNTWNHRTYTCGPRELWANCFMRLAGLPDTHFEPIRCHLIGYDVCPIPSPELFVNLTAPVGYGVASIWGLQKWMTSLYESLSEDKAIKIVKDGFNNQKAPRTVEPILKDLLKVVTDPIASNLSLLIQPNTPQLIRQPSWVIPSVELAVGIVGQTIAYLLRWMMKEWTAGGFRALNAEGNIIDLLDGNGWLVSD